MRYVSKGEFRTAEYHGYTGIYSDYDGKHPEWKGKRTIMTGENGPGTNLYIEGVSFEIVGDEDQRCPVLGHLLYDGWLVPEAKVREMNSYFFNKETK